MDGTAIPEVNFDIGEVCKIQIYKRFEERSTDGLGRATQDFCLCHTLLMKLANSTSGTSLRAMSMLRTRSQYGLMEVQAALHCKLEGVLVLTQQG